MAMASSETRKKPPKIPTPPNEAMGLVCSLRASGTSYNFFCSAIIIIAGIVKNVMMNAMDRVKTRYNIKPEITGRQK